MADEDNRQAQGAANAPAKVAETVADTTQKIVDESAKTAKRARAATARRAKRQATPQKATARRAKASRASSTSRITRNTRTAARKTAAAAQQGFETVNNNFFNGFQAVPAFAPFQSLFGQANERSQDIAQRSQRVAEELADLARSNVEAMVEASRVAAEGVRSIGQNVVASSRGGVEQTADAIRSLAEAKSPTEYMQLQSDYARASFDRAVAETSKLTESLVKLAGEAFQPLSNRATANAERFNSLVA